MNRSDTHGDVDTCFEDAAAERYHRGNLGPLAARCIEEHARRCDECRALLADVALELEVGTLLREARRETPPVVRNQIIAGAISVHASMFGDDRAAEVWE